MWLFLKFIYNNYFIIVTFSSFSDLTCLYLILELGINKLKLIVSLIIKLTSKQIKYIIINERLKRYLPNIHYGSSRIFYILHSIELLL